MLLSKIGGLVSRSMDTGINVGLGIGSKSGKDTGVNINSKLKLNHIVRDMGHIHI